MITNEQVLNALRQVMHPEFKRSLVELGMIRDISVDDSQVAFTLVLPFKEASIRDDLLRSVRRAVMLRSCLQGGERLPDRWRARWRS